MDAATGTGESSAPDELENYRRLVELQSQIVDLSRRNCEAERSCRLLQAEVERQVLGRISRRGASRIPDSIRRWLRKGRFRWLSSWIDRQWGRNGSGTPPWNVSPARTTTPIPN